jgi:rubrerythrin
VVKRGNQERSTFLSLYSLAFRLAARLPILKVMKVEQYYKDGRTHWRYYCDSCEALIGDTAPMAQHLLRDDETNNHCPICGGKITKDKPPSKPQ